MPPIENANRDINQVRVGTDPTPFSFGEQGNKTIRMCNEWLNKAKRERKKHDTNWTKYEKFYRGQQWERGRAAWRVSETLNLTFNNIRAIMPLLFDSKPTTQPLPTTPNDYEFTKMLTEILEYNWSQLGWDGELEKAGLNAQIYGIGYWYLGWDQNMCEGQGEIEFRSVKPKEIYVDPEASEIDEAKYLIWVQEMSVGEMRLKYPGKNITPQAAVYGEMQGIDPGRAEITSIDKKIYQPNDSVAIESSNDNAKADWIQVFCVDNTVEEYELEKPDESGNKRLLKKKYPKGRYISYNGNTLLEDKEMPFDDGKIPFVEFSNYMNIDNMIGFSEIQLIEGLQKAINKLYSGFLEQINLMGNPIWIVDNDSGIDTDYLVNKPGLMVEKNRGSEVRREMGVPIDNSQISIYDRTLSMFSQLSGLQEVMQGRNVPGVTSGEMLESLQEAAQIPIRYKERALFRALVKIGQMLVSRIMQFYTTPRMFRLTENKEGIPDFFEFYVDFDEEGKRVAKYRKIAGNRTEDGGVNYNENVLPQEMKISKSIYDVKITTGSTLPFQKVQKVVTARQLYSDGVIDEEEYLKAVQWPNWEAVLQRVMEKKQRMAEAQAQAQAAKQGG